MTLPHTWQPYIHNCTGAAIEFSTDGANNTFTITGRPWNRDSDGAISFGDEVTIFSDPGSDLADDAILAGTEQDNSSNLYEGMFCTAKLDTDASTDGTIDIYIQWSTDGGTDYPDDAGDFDKEVIDTDLILVASLATDSTDDDRAINFEL